MLPAFALSSPTATLIGPSAVSNPRNEAAADRAHVFGFVLFVHYRLCRCDFVLARRQVRRRPFGPCTEISDPVRCWRGDPAQIAALRSCAVLASVSAERSRHHSALAPHGGRGLCVLGPRVHY